MYVYLPCAEQLLAKIKLLTGVVEVGLFCNIAQAAYFGNQVLSSFPPLEISMHVDATHRTGVCR